MKPAWKDSSTSPSFSDEKVDDPQDVVKPGDEVDVKILRVDTDERKIGLSLKRAMWGDADGREDQPQDDSDLTPKPTRGGMDDHGALGTDKITL